MHGAPRPIPRNSRPPLPAVATAPAAPDVARPKSFPQLSPSGQVEKGGGRGVVGRGIAAPLDTYAPRGSLRRRTPSSWNRALATAGATGGTATSPMPPGASPLGKRCTSIVGASANRSSL